MSLFMTLCYDRLMRSSEDACLREWRRELLAELSGSVLEIGAGTGANVDHYPRPAVTRLVLTDFDHALVAKLRGRVWQRRVEPLWKRIAGGCHLTRTTGDAIQRAGFIVSDERRESTRKAMPIVRPTIRGTARAPG